MGKEFTLSEVAKHQSEESAWLIIDNRESGVAEVFDVTKYVEDHPGGGEILIDAAGKDSTNMFVSIGHSETAYETMAGLKIGELKLSDEEKVAKAEARRLAAERASSGGLGGVHILVILLVILAGVIFSNEEYKTKVMSMLGQ